MCQIQLVKRINGRLTKKDNREFIKLMSLGSMWNYDAFGIFNHSYHMKSPGVFDYQQINEKKITKNKFIVGHNRLATSGECLVYPEEAITINSRAGMNPWCINPFVNIANWWKSLDKGMISRNYNNHPFKINELLLVHNGIIHNDRKLRKKYKIDTQIETDSYIILYLISHFLNESNKEGRLDKIIDAIKQATKEIKGNYSVMLYDKLSRNVLYFRNEFTSFTFNIIGKDLIIGSTIEKNLKYIYEKNKSRKRFPTYPGTIYLIGDEIKEVGIFNIVERGYSRNGKRN